LKVDEHIITFVKDGKIMNKVLIFLFFYIFFSCPVFFAFANPINDKKIESDRDIMSSSAEKIEETLSGLEEKTDSIEDIKYSICGDTIINSFYYKGKKPEEYIKPFDYYNIRPLESGFSFSRRFEFKLKRRLNYDLWASVNLETYSFSGSGDISSFWGVNQNCGYYPSSDLINGCVELKASEPDISVSMGSFYPFSFSEMIFTSPRNLSVYGPPVLPARGLRMSGNIKPLTMEFIWGVIPDYYMKDNMVYKGHDTILWGGKFSLSSRKGKGGITFIQSSRNGIPQDIYGLDISYNLSKTVSLKGEIGASLFGQDKIYDHAFRLAIEKKIGNIIACGEYLWISPGYDPFKLHKTFTERELLGVGRLASNRKGFDFYLIFPLDRGEIKLEFLRFSQILPGTYDNELYMDPLFPIYENDKDVRGDFTALELYLNKNIGSEWSIKGHFEMVNLMRPSPCEVDFTQTTCLLEINYKLLDYLTIGGGVVYLNRHGTWYSSVDSSQFMPAFMIDFTVNSSLSVSIEQRNVIVTDFMDTSNDYNVGQTSIRGKIKW
jgi:hypothetical protein